MNTLGELYFGDLEAIDEGMNHKNYFLNTFILPTSFSFSSLRNDRNYVIVGRKGAGKTAAQYFMSNDLSSNGILTKFFSFYTDISAAQYATLAQTQKTDFVKIGSARNIFLYYDFRDVWKRTFLVKMAEELISNDLPSKFTAFMMGDRNRLSSLFDGILRSGSLKLHGSMGAIAAEASFDLSKFSNDEVPISDFNNIALELLRKHASSNKMYLFVDELVFSRLDAHDDEVRARAAMVRDIFRVARELNNFFHQNEIDFHIVCSLRPEIRNMLNEHDSEIGKIIDGKDVPLEWSIGSKDTSLLWKIFQQKINYSANPRLNFCDFVDNSVDFSNRKIELFDFLKNNTWARPRDLIRLLQSTAKTSPNATRISSREIKGSLNEYARASMKEIVDELSVNFGPELYQRLRQDIRKKEYRNATEFVNSITRTLSGLSIDERSFVEELFFYGVIGNIDWTQSGHRRYYYFYRGEEFFNWDFGVQVHPALWSYFNIRSN